MGLWTVAINHSPLMSSWGGVKKSAEAVYTSGWVEGLFVCVFYLFCFGFLLKDG